LTLRTTMQRPPRRYLAIGALSTGGVRGELDVIRIHGVTVGVAAAWLASDGERERMRHGDGEAEALATASAAHAIGPLELRLHVGVGAAMRGDDMTRGLAGASGPGLRAGEREKTSIQTGVTYRRAPREDFVDSLRRR
jgi:hypothetical protein